MPVEAIQEFRQRYPQYKDLSDADLAAKVIAVYPEYKDLFGDVAKQETRTWTLGPTLQRGIENFLPPTMAAAGGMLGGMAGAGAGGIGAIPGGLIGAGAMGAAGQGIAEFTRPLLTGEPPSPLGPMAGRVGQAGMISTAGEAGGQGLMAGAQRVAAPIIGKVSPFLQEFKTSIPELKLTAAQATESRAIDILENVAEASLLGGGRISQFKAGQQGILRQTADTLAEQFGSRASPAEVGAIFQQSVRESRDAFHAAAKSLYGDVDRVMMRQGVEGGASVNLRELKNEASQILTRRANVPKSLSSETGMAMLKDLADMPDATSFSSAQLMRSQLLKGGRAKDLADIQSGLSKHFAGILDDAMETAAQGLGPEALSAYRTANAFYKSGVEQFNNKFIQSLMRKTPEKVAEAIFQRGGVTVINQAKAAVSQEAFEEVQGAFLRKTFQDATDPVTNVLSANAFQAKLFGKTGVGSEALTAGLGAETRRSLQGLSEALRITQARPAEGTGRMFIQLSQAGAGIEFAFHPIRALTGISAEPATAAIILGPSLIGRLATNPRAIQWLTTGIKLGPRSAVGSRAMAQFSAWALAAPDMGESGP